MKKTDLAWAAGLLDGEGCIAIYHSSKERSAGNLYLTVQIGMTCHNTLLRFRNIVGHGSIVERGGQSSRFWQYTTMGRGAENVLRKLYPYLFTKRRQARIAFVFRSTTLSENGNRKLSDEQIALRYRCYALIAKAKKTRKHTEITVL